MVACQKYFDTQYKESGCLACVFSFCFSSATDWGGGISNMLVVACFSNNKHLISIYFLLLLYCCKFSLRIFSYEKHNLNVIIRHIQTPRHLPIHTLNEWLKTYSNACPPVSNIFSLLCLRLFFFFFEMLVQLSFPLTNQKKGFFSFPISFYFFFGFKSLLFCVRNSGWCNGHNF